MMTAYYGVFDHTAFTPTTEYFSGGGALLGWASEGAGRELPAALARGGARSAAAAGEGRPGPVRTGEVGLAPVVVASGGGGLAHSSGDKMSADPSQRARQCLGAGPAKLLG